MTSRQKKKRNEDHMDETWLVPYSDILTLLLALFIVLFASSTVDAQKYNSMREAMSAAFHTGTRVVNLDPEPDTTVERLHQTTNDLQLEQLKRQIDKYIEENNLSTELETGLKNNFLTLTIRDRALFDSGSAEIKQEFVKTIVSIGHMLEQYNQYEVVIKGHTDNVPINTRQFESNWDLSSERALNFMKLILQNKNLDPRRFSAIGYGEYRPIESNDTAEGRTKNRRVEVTIQKWSAE
ncbi:flagellar motor protein MotB [Peptococcaceae bacterium 1198_IL3148]